MLHLIYQSPLQAATLQRIAQNDAALFLENTTLHLLKNSTQSLEIKTLSLSAQLFVLMSDIETRGIHSAELIDGVNIIDYAGWVSLTTEHQTIQSWF